MHRGASTPAASSTSTWTPCGSRTVSSGELEMIRHPGASAVLPVLSADGSDDPQLLLIRQYRYATGGPIWEIPAGRLEAGESPGGVRPPRAARGDRRDRRPLGAAHHHLHDARASPTSGSTSSPPSTSWSKPGDQRREPDEFMEVKALPSSQVLEHDPGRRDRGRKDGRRCSLFRWFPTETVVIRGRSKGTAAPAPGAAEPSSSFLAQGVDMAMRLRACKPGTVPACRE